jgi:inositol polyphosphate-4-phosphatase
MRALMKLAKEKQTAGMLPICEDMISKVSAVVSELEITYDFKISG